MKGLLESKPSHSRCECTFLFYHVGQLNCLASKLVCAIVQVFDMTISDEAVTDTALEWFFAIMFISVCTPAWFTFLVVRCIVAILNQNRWCQCGCFNVFVVAPCVLAVDSFYFTNGYAVFFIATKASEDCCTVLCDAKLWHIT